MGRARLGRLVEAFLSVRESWGAVPLEGGDIAYVSNVTGLPLAWVTRRSSRGWLHDLLLPWGRRVGGLASGGGRLFLASDFDGDERWAIYEVKGVEAVRVAGEDGSMNLLGAVSPRGDLAFTGNKRNGVDFDLYLYSGGEARLVAELEGINVASEWAGGRVVMVHRNTNLDSDLYLVDPATGRAVNLTEHRGEAANGAPVYAGGGWLLYASNEGSEYSSLRALNLETGERLKLYDPGMDLEALALSDGVLYASFNRLGRSVVAWGPITLESGRPSWRPTGSLELSWVVSRLEPYPGGSALVSASGASLGTEVYLVRRGGVPEQVTWSPRLGLDREFVEPVDLHYESFDGLRIHMLYYRPRRPAREPPPAVVWLHGGPESQARPAFHPVIQAILSLGIAVAAPNFRGSTGYGKTFTHLDDVEKRMDAVRDVAEAVRSLAERRLVDPERLCAMGGSYGGYLTLMTLAINPELWRCGVEIVGIFNLVTFIRNTSPYRRRYRIAEYGDPEKHEKIMLELSPATHADKIRAPLLVIHGAKDPRVPVSEAEQLVEKLRARGVRVEYLRFEDEGHGIAKLENRLKAYTKALEFIAEHLLDEE